MARSGSRSGGLRTTTGRAAPARSRATRCSRTLAGKWPQWPGRLDQPHTFHFLPDIARGLLTLADHQEADGQVWHLPAAEPLTAQQSFDMIGKTAGRPMPVRASGASPALLAAAGMFSPLLREMRETAYQFRRRS